jgi:hypothetical protein
MIRHGPQRKRRVQKLVFVLYVCCCGDVFTEPLPNNGGGDKHTATQTGGRVL